MNAPARLNLAAARPAIAFEPEPAPARIVRFAGLPSPESRYRMARPRRRTLLYLTLTTYLPYPTLPNKVTNATPT